MALGEVRFRCSHCEQFLQEDVHMRLESVLFKFVERLFEFVLLLLVFVEVSGFYELLVEDFQL